MTQNIVNNLYVTYVDNIYKCDTFFPTYEIHFNLVKIVNALYSKNEGCDVIFRHYKQK